MPCWTGLDWTGIVYGIYVNAMLDWTGLVWSGRTATVIHCWIVMMSHSVVDVCVEMSCDVVTMV